LFLANSSCVYSLQERLFAFCELAKLAKQHHKATKHFLTFQAIDEKIVGVYFLRFSKKG